METTLEVVRLGLVASRLFEQAGIEQFRSGNCYRGVTGRAGMAEGGSVELVYVPPSSSGEQLSVAHKGAEGFLEQLVLWTDKDNCSPTAAFSSELKPAPFLDPALAASMYTPSRRSVPALKKFLDGIRARSSLSAAPVTYSHATNPIHFLAFATYFLSRYIGDSGLKA